MSFYPETLYIDYPQEKVDGKLYEYRCVYCKRLTTDINGSVNRHAESCEYRKEHTYFELED